MPDSPSAIIARMSEAIIADLKRQVPLSGSRLIYDVETGVVDYEGAFRPIEIAQAAARVIVEACAKRAFDALEKLGEPTQALIVSDALRALLENANDHANT